jgi:type I restriction enzyme S subunit
MKAGWQNRKLGDVLQKTETVNPLQTPNKEFDYIDVSSVSNATFSIKETQRLKGKDAPSRARKLVKDKDVIFATIRPTLRRIAIVPKHLDNQICSTGYFVLRANPEIAHRYLFYCLFAEDFMGRMESLQKGASYPAVTDGDVKSQEIPVPPLPEQERIVGILDEAFDGIAKAKATAEANLQNARALFQSHLQTVFSQQGEGWVEKTLGEVCEMYQPKTIGTKDLIPNGPYPVFGANGIIGNYDQYNHEDPQLLITCRGATCGSVNISLPKSWITGNAMVVRPMIESLNLKFLEYVFRGGVDLSKAITGAAQPQITRTNLSPIQIRFPGSVAQQKRLAETFESLSAETQRLESLYQNKLKALDDLKKSLLHQAFTGNL